MNYLGTAHPDLASVPPISVSNVGWDISHARRFVHFFLTFDECRDVLLDPTVFNNTVLTLLTNQFLYGAFTKVSHYMHTGNSVVISNIIELIVTISEV
jgi:hypothetical protein